MISQSINIEWCKCDRNDKDIYINSYFCKSKKIIDHPIKRVKIYLDKKAENSEKKYF